MLAVRWGWGLAILMLLSSSARAEVQSVSESGFVIAHQRPVNVSRTQLYGAASKIESWWDPSHSYSGNADNLSLNLEPGGMFLERLPGGGFVEHMRVTMLMPERMVRFTGGLGPLATDGLAGSMTWSFADGEEDGTSKLVWRYSVGGYRPDGLKELADAVDGVLQIQVDRLVKLAEASEKSPQQELDNQVDKVDEAGAAIVPSTANTYTRGNNFQAPSANIEQFAFFVGRWTGKAMGGWCEEVWSAPAAGEMQGMFQFVEKDKVQFRELFALRKSDANVWELRLKHFDSGMNGWEEKEEMTTFQLLKVTPNQAVFDGMTMTLEPSGILMVYVRTKNSEGELGELEFKYSKD